MAFVRRKGNSYYLVHNVRRGGKVQQLHLARLGERARITDEIVREVTKKHPFVELNWRSLREQLNNQIDLADPAIPRRSRNSCKPCATSIWILRTCFRRYFGFPNRPRWRMNCSCSCGCCIPPSR